MIEKLIQCDDFKKKKSNALEKHFEKKKTKTKIPDCLAVMGWGIKNNPLPILAKVMASDSKFRIFMPETSRLI